MSKKSLIGKIIYAVICLVVILIALAIAGILFLGPIVKTGAEKVGPIVTGVPVTMESCTFNPFETQLTIDSFYLGNPEGFNTPEAFKVNHIFVNIDQSTLFDDVLIVDSIIIDGAEITYQQGLTTSNLHTILNNLTKSEEKEEELDEQAEENNQKGSKKVIIRDVVVTNTFINVSVKGIASRAPIPMPDLHLTNIGGDPKELTVDVDKPDEERGVTWVGAAQEIFQGILASVVDVAAKGISSIGDAAAGAGEAIGDTVSGAWSATKGLFGNDAKKEE